MKEIIHTILLLFLDFWVWFSLSNPSYPAQFSESEKPLVGTLAKAAFPAEVCHR